MERRRQTAVNYVNYIAEKLTIYTNSQPYVTVCTHYKACSLGSSGVS